MVPSLTNRVTRQQGPEQTTARPEFDVALSFAGEDRQYVSQVAEYLRRMGFRVFYDKYEQISLWGKDLYSHLAEVYSERSRYTVMFISSHYAKKLWTSHERRAAQERAFRESQEYILPVRFDPTKIPGILDTVGYLDLADLTPAHLAEQIKKKIGPLRRKNFMPVEHDGLYEWLGTEDPEYQTWLSEVVFNIYEKLALMTVDERTLVYTIALHTCPGGPENDGDVHINIDLLSRITGLKRRSIRAKLSRLECMGFTHEMTGHRETTKTKNILRVEYDPLVSDLETTGEDPEDSPTFVLWAMLGILNAWQCPVCALRAAEDLDFSVLSKMACQTEEHEVDTGNRIDEHLLVPE